jgi:uncharacterized protein (TIGR02145 family)
MPTVDSNKLTVSSVTDSSYTVKLSGLKAATTYYVRAFAVNATGIGYSSQIAFQTKGGPPQALTEMAILRPNDTVLLVGKVKGNDLATTVSFEYGTTVNYGSTATALQSSLSNAELVEVSTKLSGLQRNTTYHFRIRAENEKGIAYGEDKTFRVNDPDGTVGTMTDIDGNTYRTIVIGSQIWMMENLKTTTFNDGTAIPNVKVIPEWAQLSTPAYSWYGNNESLYRNSSYGALYNWYAVGTGKLAPAGWHVPSKEEWLLLFNYLLGAGVAGGKMKEAGLDHWMWPNVGATNSSGFTALPAGARFDSGFTFMGETGFWWTSTASPSQENAFYYYLSRDSESVNTDVQHTINQKVKGFSVRCIKD